MKNLRTLLLALLLLGAPLVHSTVTFIESPDAVNGATGDAVTWLWNAKTGTVTFDTSIKNNGLGSWKVDSGAGNSAANLRIDNVGQDAGTRLTGYFYFSSFPGSTISFIDNQTTGGAGATEWKLSITSAGVLTLVGNTLSKTGSTLSTGTWYRLAVGYTATSTSVFTVNVYLDDVVDIAATGADGTLLGDSARRRLHFGWFTAPGANKVLYLQNVIVDDGSDNGDIGNYHTTAKLPSADGTLTEWTTAIGAAAGAHFDDVAERPGAEANGWSIATTLVKTEEYSIQGVSVGDVNLTGLTLLDYMGWVRAKISATTGTPVTNIILAGSASAITLTASYVTYKKMAGSTTYPVGLVDIGTNGLAASSRTFSLAEAGIVFAYAPAAPPAGGCPKTLALLGVGC